MLEAIISSSLSASGYPVDCLVAHLKGRFFADSEYATEENMSKLISATESLVEEALNDLNISNEFKNELW